MVNGFATGDGAVKTLYGGPPRLRFPESVTSCISGIRVLPGDASLLATDRCARLLIRLDRATP